MQKQLLAIAISAILAMAILPYQTVWAQEEEPKPEPTITEFAEIINDAAAEEIEIIIAADPELTNSIAETAEIVAADPEVKPEITEAINELENEVSNVEIPAEVFTALNDSVTTTEVLMTLGGLETTSVAEEFIENEITIELIVNDPELGEAVDVITCDFFNAVLNGTSVEVALEGVPGDIAEAVAENVTPAEVEAVEAGITSDAVIAEISTGEADVAGSVEDAAVTEIEGPVVTPEPDTTPDTDPTPGHDSEHETIIAQNTEIIELQKETNSLLRQLLAAEQNNDD